tara:strand:- start:133 stop:1251 length:1119 start_codon:yes stop_codon:yes gene_type:complete
MRVAGFFSFLIFALPSTLLAREIEVKEPASYSFYDNTILQIKVRGEYGRYLRFAGRTVNQYSGTPGIYKPGSPGSINCTDYGTSITCNRTGYKAPSYTPPKPGGIQRQGFLYDLDCVDGTFDRKGDYLSSGGGMKGWMSVHQDPVAKEVYSKYCRIIDELPKYVEGQKAISTAIVSPSTKPWTFLGGYCNSKEKCKILFVRDIQRKGKTRIFDHKLFEPNNPDIQIPPFYGELKRVANCETNELRVYGQLKTRKPSADDWQKHVLNYVCTGNQTKGQKFVNSLLKNIDQDRWLEFFLYQNRPKSLNEAEAYTIRAMQLALCKTKNKRSAIKHVESFLRYDNFDLKLAKRNDLWKKAKKANNNPLAEKPPNCR